jgi:hypothetical protein
MAHKRRCIASDMVKHEMDVGISIGIGVKQAGFRRFCYVSDSQTVPSQKESQKELLGRIYIYISFLHTASNSPTSFVLVIGLDCI